MSARAAKGKVLTPKRPRVEMNRFERVEATINGEDVDRVPVCFWHHFKPAGSGRSLALQTEAFFDAKFDLDIMKVMPDIPYPFPRKSVRNSEDWRLVEPLANPGSSFLIERNKAVHELQIIFRYDTPIIITVFSPLAEALYMAETPQTFLQHAQESPAVVHQALATIAENLRLHIALAVASGADGVFFAAQGCSHSLMSEEMYREFGRPYDLLALQGAADGWLNVLHIHGEKDLMFDAMLDYPVQVLSWSDRIAGPSLREARALTSKCLMGGWNEFGALSNGPVAEIEAEAFDAMAQTNGRKFIMANGCSVPDDTDEQWLHAARNIASKLHPK